MKQGDRSFTISDCDLNYKGGRYIITGTEGPLQAAKRAATKLFGKLEDSKYASHKNSNTIHFVLRETTVGSTKDRRAYKAKRAKLDKPVEIKDKAGKVMYTVKYTYTVAAHTGTQDVISSDRVSEAKEKN